MWTHFKTVVSSLSTKETVPVPDYNLESLEWIKEDQASRRRMIWIPPLPTSKLSLFLLMSRRPSLLTRKRGRSQIIRQRESPCSSIHVSSAYTKYARKSCIFLYNGQIKFFILQNFNILRYWMQKSTKFKIGVNKIFTLVCTFKFLCQFAELVPPRVYAKLSFQLLGLPIHHYWAQ